MRRSRLRLYDLENRIAPAVVSWDGGANDGLWLTPANWSGDTLPGLNDDVMITSSNFAVNYAGGATTVKSLTMAMGTTLNVTGGNLSVTGALDFSDEYCTLVASGGASFSAAGASDVSPGFLSANSAATITLSGMTTVDASVVNATTFDSSGAGSEMNLSALTSVTGSPATYGTLFRAFDGGKTLVPNVTTLDQSSVDVYSSGAGALVDFSALTTYVSPSGTTSFLTARQGSEIKVNAGLTTLDRVTLSLGESSTFPANQLTSVSRATIYVYGSTVTFTNLATATELSVSLDVAANVSMPALTTIPDHPNVDVAYLAYSGSTLSLPNLVTIDATSNTTRFRAQGGSTISLPAVTKIDTGTVELRAQDAGSVLSMPALTTLAFPGSSYGYVYSIAGGQLNVNAGLTKLNRVDLIIESAAGFPVGQLTEAVESRIYVNDDTVTFTNLATFGVGLIEVTNVDTVANFPALTNFITNSSNYSYLRAYSGGKLSAPALTSIIGGNPELRAQGAGAVLDLPTLAAVTPDANTFASIIAYDGGTLNVAAGFSKFSRSSVYVTGATAFPYSQITSVTESSIYVDGGIVTFSNLATATNTTLQTTNTGTEAHYPALTSYVTNPNYFVHIRAYSGSLLSAPALTSITGGYFDLRAQDSGSVLNLPGLASATPDPSAYFNLVGYYGGKVNLSPSFTAIHRANVYLDSSVALPVGQFSSLFESTLYVEGGTVTFTNLATSTNSSIQTNFSGTVGEFPALTTFTGNINYFTNLRAYGGSTLSAPALTKIDTPYVELRAEGGSAVLNLPALATLAPPPGSYSNLYAFYGGTISVSPGLTTLSRTTLIVDSTTGFPVGQIASASDCSFYLHGGSPNFSSLTDFHRGLIQADYGATPTFPVLTTLVSNNTHFLNLYAYNGATLSLPAVTQINTGYVEIRAQYNGTVEVPALTSISFPTGTYGNFNIHYGGKVVSSPGLTTLNSINFSLDSNAGYATGNITQTKDTNLYISGGTPVFTNLATFDGGRIETSGTGTKATFPALTSFLANSNYTSYIRAFGDSTISAPALTKIDTGFLQVLAQATNAEVNLPALTYVAAPVGTAAYINVDSGTFKTAPNFEIYNTSMSFNDSTTFNWSNFTIGQLSYIGGFGKLPGNVTNSGTLAAGYYSAKTIEIAGNYTQTSTGDLQVFLAGFTTPGVDHTQYIVGGTAQLAGRLMVYRFNGYVPAIGNVHTLVTAPSVTGTFVNYLGLDTGGGAELLPVVNPTSFQLNTVAASGPIVIGFQPTGNVFSSVSFVDVQFSEAIDGGTFDPVDVVVTGPGGPYTPTSIGAIGINTFRIYLPTLTTIGSYTVTIGPHVSDTVGNKMNQNGNGTNGEDPADAFSAGFTIVTADLSVQSITALPANLFFGRTFSFDYTVRNDGNAAAAGLWFDNVYLSTDAVLDGGDTYIGYGQSSGLPLNPASTYTATATVTLPTNPARPDGDYYLIVLADGGNQITEANEGNNSLATPATNIKTPPRVAELKVNGGAAQRSRTDSFTVEFNEVVTFSAGPLAAFTLNRQGGGGAVTLTSPVVDNSGGITRVTFNFADGPLVLNGGLADGRYELKAIAGSITDATGLSLDGNVDGVTGDDYVNTSAGTQGIFRLFGDADGNAYIESTDFLAFRLAFLSMNPVFNFDASPLVDSADFLAFRLRFLTSV